MCLVIKTRMMKKKSDTLYNRLEKLESVLELKPSEMASLGGCSRATYYRYRKGESAPTVQFLNRILKYEKKVNAEWLFDGKGTVLKNVDDAGYNYKPSDNKSEVSFYDFPLYKMHSDNGESKLLPESISFSGEFLNLLFEKDDYNGAFTMIVEDDCMMPEVKEGGIILVDNQQVKPYSDGIYVVRYDEFVRVKIVQPLPGNRLMLTTLNKKYEPIIIQKDQDEFEILGRVLWSTNPM